MRVLPFCLWRPRFNWHSADPTLSPDPAKARSLQDSCSESMSVLRFFEVKTERASGFRFRLQCLGFCMTFRSRTQVRRLSKAAPHRERCAAILHGLLLCEYHVMVCIMFNTHGCKSPHAPHVEVLSHVMKGLQPLNPLNHSSPAPRPNA